VRARAGVALAAVALLASACRELNPDFVAPGPDGTGTGVESTSAVESTTSSSSSSMGEPTSTMAEPSSSSSSSSEGTATDIADSGTSSTATAATTGPCPPGEMECFGQCTDLMTDNDNCGECGMDCHPVQETCVRGSCTPD
jgi:hypothetical protein